MTEKEIAVLGHAFFDGKTLQRRPAQQPSEWKDWKDTSCPAFSGGFIWRIKPEYPKTITICTFVSDEGSVYSVVKDSEDYRVNYAGWTRIKSLDQVVEVE